MQYDVVLCTYNGEKYIREQLESIFCQTLQPKCVHIGDDGSTDSTIKIVRRACDSVGINYVITKNKYNLGYARNFLVTAARSSAQYVALCDQDDVWMPNKMEVLSKAAREEGWPSMLFSNATLVGEDLTELSGSLWERLAFDPAKRDVRHEILRRNLVTGATAIVRKDVIDLAQQVNGVDIPHDALLALLASLRGELLPVDAELIYYRQHDNNVLGALAPGYSERLSKLISGQRQQMRSSFVDERNKIGELLVAFGCDNTKLADFQDHWGGVQRSRGHKGIRKCQILQRHRQYVCFDHGWKAMILDLLS